jgi:hypothetical protein
MVVSLGDCGSRRQLRSVQHTDLRLVCVSMACETVRERMLATAALAVNDRVSRTEDYITGVLLDGR